MNCIVPLGSADNNPSWMELYFGSKLLCDVHVTSLFLYINSSCIYTTILFFRQLHLNYISTK